LPLRIGAASTKLYIERGADWCGQGKNNSFFEGCGMSTCQYGISLLICTVIEPVNRALAHPHTQVRTCKSLPYYSNLCFWLPFKMTALQLLCCFDLSNRPAFRIAHFLHLLYSEASVANVPFLLCLLQLQQKTSKSL